MILGNSLWAVMSIIAKYIYLTSNILPYELVYFRCLFPIILTFFYCYFAKVDPLQIPQIAGKPLFYRVLFSIFGMMFGFTSLKLLSYSKHVSISYIYPLLTQIGAYFLINEKLTIYDGISCILSFFGVIIVTTNYNGQQKNDEPKWAFIMPIGAAIFWSLGDIYQRKLKSTVHYMISPFYQYLGGAIFIVFIGIAEDSIRNDYTPYGIKEIILLIIMAILGTVGTAFYAFAFQLEKAGRLSALNYLTVPYSLLSDYFLFSVNINIYNVLGAFLVISGSCTISILKGFGILE